jgi:tetratricopeptide (TPR) repeat protein
MRRLNTRLLVWLVAVAVPSAVTVHLLHGFQVARNADTLVTRARAKQARGETDEATRLLSRYVGLRPDDAAASAELATTLLTRLQAMPATQRDVSRTFAALETAVRDNPADGPLRLKLADLCVRLGRHADAQHHLSQVMSPRTDADAGDASNAAVELVRARVAIGTDDLPAAVQILAAMVGFDPESKAFVSPGSRSDSDTATALTLLAAVFDTTFDDPATADVVMRRLPQVCPDDPQAWIALARWHLDHDDLEAAAAAAAHSHALAAGNAEAALICIEVALARGDFTAAEQAIEPALAAHPDDDRMYRAQGLLAIRRGWPEEAAAALRAGLARQPESSSLRAMLAELLLEQGDLTAARDMIDSLIATEGRDAPIVGLLEGWCLVEQRQWLSAKQVLERLRPQLAAADQVRRRVDLLLVRCLGPLGAFDEQLSVCQSLLAEDPDLAAARLGAASALAALGRPAEALDLLDDTAVNLADEATALRAECLLARGQVDAAIDLLTRAIERQPADPQLRATLVEALFRQQGPKPARELLATIPAALAVTPPLLVARALVAASQPPDDAGRELAAIEAAAESMAADEKRIVLTGLARLQASRGDHDAAGRLWAAVRETHPDDLTASWEIHGLAAATGDAEATRAALEAIERIAGSSSADGRAARAGQLLLRVAAAVPDRDGSVLEEARHLLIEAEAERPSWQRIHLLLAETERLRGDGQAECERLQQALAVGPRHAAIARRLMTLLVAERRFDEAARLANDTVADAVVATALLGRRPEPTAWRAAVTLLESLASRGLLPLTQRVQLADLWDRLGHWEECRAELQSLAAAPDAAPMITALLVDKLIEHDELAAARSWFTKLARTSSEFPDLLVLEARLAAASGDWQAARVAVEKCVPVRPVRAADMEAARRAARLMEELQLTESADPLYAEIASVAPAGVVDRAEFLARQQRIDEAIRLLGKLLHDAPATVPRQRILRAAVTAVQAADPVESPHAFATVAQWLSEAADEAADAPALRLLRAEFAAARGNQAVAESLYRAVLDDEQAGEEARAVAANNLAFGRAAPSTADEASTLIDSAIATLGHLPDLLDTRGMVRLAQGNVTAAVGDLEEACLVPSPAKLVHLAAAYGAAGDTERAAAALRRARRLTGASLRLDSRDQTLLEQVERQVSAALKRP